MAMVKLQKFWRLTLAPQFFCIQVVKAMANAGWGVPDGRAQLRYIGRVEVPEFPAVTDVIPKPPTSVTVALPPWDARVYYRMAKLIGSTADGSCEVEYHRDDVVEGETLPRHVLRSNILPRTATSTLGIVASLSTEKFEQVIQAALADQAMMKKEKEEGKYGEPMTRKKTREEFAQSFYADDQKLGHAMGGGADTEHTFPLSDVTCFDTLPASTSTGRAPVLLVASGSIVRAYDFDQLGIPVMKFDAGSEVLCLCAEASGNRFVCGTRDGLLIVVGIKGGSGEEEFEVVVRICHDMSRQLGIAHKASATQRTAILCCATYMDLQALNKAESGGGGGGGGGGKGNGKGKGKGEKGKQGKDRETFSFISGGEDGKLRSWNSQGECLQTFDGHNGPVTACRVDRTGAPTLISGSADCTVRMWTLTCGEIVTSQRVKLPLRGHTAAIIPSGVRFSSLFHKASSQSDKQCSWPVVVTCSEAEVIVWSFYGKKIAFFPIRVPRYGTITRLDIGTRDEIVLGTSKGYTLECVFKGPWIDGNYPAHVIAKAALEEGISGHRRDLRKGVPAGMERVFTSSLDGVPRSTFRHVKGSRRGLPARPSEGLTAERAAAYVRLNGPYGQVELDDPSLDFSHEDFQELVQAMEKEGLQLNAKSRQAATAIAQAVTNTNLTPKEVREAAIALSLPEGTAEALAKVAAGASLRSAVAAVKSSRSSPAPEAEAAPESEGKGKKKRKKNKGKR